MALKSAGEVGRNTKFSTLTELTNLPAGDGSLTAFNGYANMAAMIGSTGFSEDAYPCIQAVNGTTNAPVTGTSGWYLPSYAQMLEVLGMYYGFGDNIAIDNVFKATVDAAISAAIGERFVEGETNQNYLTSTLNADKSNLTVAQMKWDANSTAYSVANATPAFGNAKGWVRPVLTVFKTAE